MQNNIKKLLWKKKIKAQQFHFLFVVIRITICDKRGVYNIEYSLEVGSRFEKLQVPIYWNFKTIKSFKTP